MGPARLRGGVGRKETFFFFANVTNWSDMAREHIMNHVEAQVKMVAETHVKKEAATPLLKEFKRRGIAVTAAWAKQSANMDEGSHGGTWTMIDTTIGSFPLAESTDEEGASPPWHNLSRGSVCMDGLEIIVLWAGKRKPRSTK